MDHLNFIRLSHRYHLWVVLSLIFSFSSLESISQTLCNPPIAVNAGADVTIACGGTASLGEVPPPTTNNPMAPSCTTPGQLTQGGGVYLNSVSTTGGINGNNISNSNTMINGIDPMGPQAWQSVWYSNYTTQIVESTPGGTFNLAITAKSLYNNAPYSIRIWIDWNNNGTFDNTPGSELVYTSPLTNTSPFTFGSIPINVPAGQQSGVFRMRIRAKDNAPFVASDNACTYNNPQGIVAPYAGYTGNQTGAYWFSSEVEDYGVKISGSGSAPGGGYTYSWTPASGLNNPNISNPTATPPGTTVYTVTVTDPVNNCISTDQVTVTVTAAVTPTFTNPGPICSGSAFTLPATSTNGINGTWSPAVNNTATTTYTFTPAAGQCALTATMTVVVNNQLVPAFTNPGPVCSGTVFSLPATSDNGIAGSWSPAIDNTATTTYTFTPNNAACVSSTTLTVVVANQVVPAFTNPGPVCSGTAFSLPATSNNGITGTWSPAIDNTATTTYTFTPATAGCGSPVTMTVVINPGFEITLSHDIDICQGETIPQMLVTAVDGLAPYTYTYAIDGGNPVSITSSQNPSVINLAAYPGLNADIPACYDFSISGIAAGSCQTSNTVFGDYICIHPKPDASFSVNSGIDGLFSLNNTSTGASSYVWDFGDNSGHVVTENPIHQFPAEISADYVVELIAYNEAGCRDTAYHVISIEEELIFYVPNAFTPDGDEHNNTFKPVMTSGYDPNDYQLEIYDRWGECLFISKNATVGWDGTFKGTMVQDGVYPWKITFKMLRNDDKKEYVGHVNKIR